MLSNATYLPSHPAAVLCQTNRAFRSSAHSMISVIALFVKPKQLARDVPQFVVLSQWLSANLSKIVPRVYQKQDPQKGAF